jgi:hypothetical protein
MGPLRRAKHCRGGFRYGADASSERVVIARGSLCVRRGGDSLGPNVLAGDVFDEPTGACGGCVVCDISLGENPDEVPAFNDR